MIDGSEKSDGWLNIELQSPYVIKIKVQSYPFS